MRFAWIGLVAALVAGCTTDGRDFAKPQAGTIMLGKTTRQDITNLYGPPFAQSAVTLSDEQTAQGTDDFAPARVGGTLAQYRYMFLQRLSTLVSPRPYNDKALTVVFWNGIAVAWRFISDFEDTSTDFDAGKAASLEKGKMTKAQAIALMGEPTGRVIYPMIRQQGDQALVYQYQELLHGQRNEKFLSLLFGPDDVLRDYRLITRSN